MDTFMKVKDKVSSFLCLFLEPNTCAENKLLLPIPTKKMN
jgi:hypothetical protein